MLVSSPYYLEHRLYLPIVGFIFVVYGITGTAVEIFPAVWRYAGVLAVLVLAAINYAYCDSFSSALLLWQSAVRASPSSAVAHNSLAVAYMERGVLFAAEQEITRALAIDPLLSNALNNRALLLMNRGMLKEAESDLEKAAATDHHNYLIYVHYAQLRLLQNRPDEITPFLEKALRINPEYLPAYKMLAEYYAGKGQYEKAVPFIEELNKRPEGRKIAEAAFAGIDRRTVSGNNAARNKN
jgi:Tfp pilus assembly protein PilF